MTVVKFSKFPKEVLGRPLVILDPWFVQTRYDQDSFVKIASRRRQLTFGVTLGLRESVLGLPFAKIVLEGEGTIAAVCPSPPSSPLVQPVTAYTDVLPIRMALYLEPDVPDEFGEKVRRLEQLVVAAKKMRRKGLTIAPEMKAEVEAVLEELERIRNNAKVFRKLMSGPGYMKVTVLTPNGMTTLSLRVERTSQSVTGFIEGPHLYLHRTIGVVMNPENAVRLRDAIVRARAEGTGEAQLRVRLIVSRVGNSFAVKPYDNPVSHKGGDDVREQLEFLNRLMGESFIVETAERKVKKGRGSVAFQGLLTIKAAFHPDADNRGHEQISIGEG
jgi:hypothetical protein